MHRLLIDCRFAATGTGLSRFTRELMGEFLALPQVQRDFAVTLLVRSADETWLAALPKPFAVVAADIPHYALSEHWVLPRVIRAAGAQVYLALQFNLPFLCPVPCVPVVHDLILHRYPNGAGLLKQIAYRSILSRSLRQAQRIVAVSQTTADELGRHYGLSLLPNVIVSGEGVSAQFSPADPAAVEGVQQRYGLSCPYFMYVGNGKAHKNVEDMADEFSARVPANTELVIVSGDPLLRSCASIAHVRVLSPVPDADLPALYTGALAFVSMSDMEGFGLPVLEAAACGCPSIVHDIPAFREVARPSTRLVEDFDAFTQTVSDCRAHPWRDDRTELPDWQSPASRVHSAVLQAILSSH